MHRSRSHIMCYGESPGERTYRDHSTGVHQQSKYQIIRFDFSTGFAITAQRYSNPGKPQLSGVRLTCTVSSLVEVMVSRLLMCSGAVTPEKGSRTEPFVLVSLRTGAQAILIRSKAEPCNKQPTPNQILVSTRMKQINSRRSQEWISTSSYNTITKQEPAVPQPRLTIRTHLVLRTRVGQC